MHVSEVALELMDQRLGLSFQQTVASVLIPNGPGFQVPSIVQLRPLTPNALYNISSGAIKVSVLTSAGLLCESF